MYAISQVICGCGSLIEKDLLCEVRMEESQASDVVVGATSLASYGNALVDI